LCYGATAVRLCQHCRRPIVGRRRDAKYCSARCNNRACESRAGRRAGKPRDRVRRFCCVCGAEFVTKRFSQVYCGKPCKWWALNARRIDKRRRTDADPRVSPALIMRRTAAIRSKWTVTEIRRRRTANVRDESDAESGPHQGRIAG
jgi:hypothetical protein